MPEGLFRQFHRDSRPLSDYLMRAYGQPLVESARTLAAAHPDADPDVLVAQLLSDPRVAPPGLLGTERASTRDGDGQLRPTAEPGVRLFTSRHYVAIQVTGDTSLLEWWPDTVGGELEPIDPFEGDGWDQPPPGAPYDFERELARHEFQIAQDRWFLGLRDDHGPTALYTWLDLTEDEEQAVLRGERDLAAEVTAMRARIEPIVAAIGEQTAAFYDGILPPLLREAVIRQQQRLRARRAVQESLSFPQGWKQTEPVLDEPDAASAVPSTVVELDTVELHIAPPDVRLSGASYTDVLRTLRVWADAVERHPAAYATLVEDRISDLIAATLNAALPGAHR